MDFPPITANCKRQNSKDFHFLFLFRFEHVQGCVGPHFSVYTIAVSNTRVESALCCPLLPRSSAVSLLPDCWGGLGGGGGLRQEEKLLKRGP